MERGQCVKDVLNEVFDIPKEAIEPKYSYTDDGLSYLSSVKIKKTAVKDKAAVRKWIPDQIEVVFK